jgi:hypothetical protein
MFDLIELLLIYIKFRMVEVEEITQSEEKLKLFEEIQIVVV